MISSIEVKILENICLDRNDSDMLFLHLLDTLQYDNKKRRLRFISLIELWKKGLVIKKYIEYPSSTLSGLDNIFGEIKSYLQKDSYIVHFVDENIVREDIVYITDILSESNRISFFSKKLSGKVEKETISYKEYGKRFLPSGLENQMVRFDVYRPIAENDLCEIIGSRQQKRKRIGIKEELQCLLNWHEAVSDSVQVLLEWLFIVQGIYEKKSRKHMEYIQDMINERKNSRKYLHFLIKVYNEIIQQNG